MYVYKSMAESRVTNAHHIINSALTGSRSPAGPRRLGTATRIIASLSRRLSAFFESTSRPRSQSGKVRRNRGLPDGAAITTLDTYCTFTNIPGPGVRTAYFAALGSWPGGAPEERREPAEQRCAYARRCSEGVAAPLGCATLFSICPCCISCARRTGFLRVRGGGGITTLGVLRVLSKRPVPICQND